MKRADGVTAASAAREAGCSHVLAGRLLKRGSDAAADCWNEPARRHGARLPGRQCLGSRSRSTAGRRIHALMSFAEAQRQKEEALAQLRQIEVAKRRGELLPIQPRER